MQITSLDFESAKTPPCKCNERVCPTRQKHNTAQHSTKQQKHKSERDGIGSDGHETRREETRTARAYVVHTPAAKLPSELKREVGHAFHLQVERRIQYESVAGGRLAFASHVHESYEPLCFNCS